jgi:hypothetical protein
MTIAATTAVAQVEVQVSSKVVTERFTGVGYHAEMFLNSATPEFFDQVIAKRWKELNPGFARVFHRWGRGPKAVRDQEALDAFLKQFLFLKEATGTEVYFTTGGPKDTAPGAEREAYARAVADELEYLLKGGATNVRTYCMSNELSMGQWAAMTKDLDKFRDYHRLIHAELARRGLKIDLLSTDASPISNWGTIKWAAANMDEITEVYGGHHYANDHAPEDLTFYGWFRDQCADVVKLARSKGKEFILGEFGPAQYLQHKYGVRWDTCKYYGTKQEPIAGLQLAEATMAAMNAGVRAMGYWTFMDYPDDEKSNRINQWGLFKWLKNDAQLRLPYYSYGMLTKYFRGPARVMEVTTGDPLIRAAAVRHEKGTWSVAIVNRMNTEASVKVTLPENVPGPFRKYEYVVAAPPATEDGDLPDPCGKLNKLTDKVKPLSLTIYTTAYDDDAPTAVEGLKAEKFRYLAVPGTPTMAQRVSWNRSVSPDVIYYRVFYGGERIGSSTSTEFVDADVKRPRGLRYAVAAVDSSGNASQKMECEAGN